MNISKLNYQQVESLANQLKMSSENMQQILGEVSNLLNRIGSTDVWSGTTASMTKERFDTLVSVFPKFYEAISECHTYLISVVESYKNVDASISNS